MTNYVIRTKQIQRGCEGCEDSDVYEATVDRYPDVADYGKSEYEALELLFDTILMLVVDE